MKTILKYILQSLHNKLPFVETMTNNKVKQKGNTMKIKTLFYFCRCEDNKKRNTKRCKFIL